MIVRIKGVKKATGRNGALYYYDRVTGKRIKAPYGTAEFVAELSELRRKHNAPEPLAAKREGTWGWLVTYWRGETPEWQGLKERTVKDYLRVIDYLKPLDEMPLSEMTEEAVIGIRNKAFSKHKRRFANYVLAVISRAWTVGQAAGKVPHGNPINKSQKVRKPRGSVVVNRPWTPSELEIVFAAMAHPIQVAMALAVFAGWREGDVCAMKASAYDGTNIEGRQGKTGDLVWMPAHSTLKLILDAELKRLPRLPDAPLVINLKGRPFTESGFRASFFKVMRKLRGTGAVNSGLTFHGLRVTLATWIADQGGDTRDIAAALGHATEAMAVHYARHAERKRRAARAVAFMEQRTSGILENMRTGLENVFEATKKPLESVKETKGLDGSGGGT